jgi:uncharacterized protein (TIGR00270 family)
MSVCEMCGKSGYMVSANVEGVDLKVCKECTKYGTVKKFSQKPGFSKPGFSKNRDFKPRFEGPALKIVSNYSDLLKKARADKEMSQEDFATFLQVKESQIAKWENASLRPRIGEAKKIGRTLNIRLVEKDIKEETKSEKKRPKNDELTLGDFIKVKTRK